MYVQGHSRLISVGAYIPEERVTSRSLMEEIDTQALFGIGSDWLERVTGVKERRFAPEDMTPSAMGARAATEALEIAGVRPTDIDAIIYTGITRDFVEPSTAHIVQHKIGARNALAFDIANACHGFVNGMHMMDMLIATGQVRRGLVVTGEKICRYTRMAVQELKKCTDRATFHKLAAGLSLGDAGAAIVMGPKLKPETGFMGFMLGSDPRFHEFSSCGRNGKDTPLETDMGILIKEGLRLSEQFYKQLMTKLNWAPGEISRCVQQQASRAMIRQIAAYVGVSAAIAVDTVTMYGNLGTANIPINLYLLQKEQSLNDGDKVLITGGGSGIAVSSTGLIWNAA